MRIALVIPTLDRSGAEKQLTLLAVGLKEQGAEPHVFTLDRGGPYRANLTQADVPVTVVGKRSKFDATAIRSLRAAISEFQPDVLHTWLFSAHAYGYLAARKLDVHWVQSLRCVDSWKAGWQRWVDRRLWPKVARFVANGQCVKDWYVEQGVAAETIDVIPNGVPVPSILRANSLRHELDLPDDAQIVLAVGRLAPQKRLKDLLWAFQLTRQANERAWMIIVGDGPQRAELIEYSKSVECFERVKFVGHCDAPASYFEAADIFWLGSDFEGQSNSLQEAMSYGLPIVASDIGPNRELITHGEHGYLVDVGDSAGFAQFTTRYLEQPEDATSKGAAARQRIEANFSVAAMVEEYARVYEKLNRPTQLDS